MNYKELMDLALAHYEEGGDGIYECWDEREFNHWVENFGEITKEKALEMFANRLEMINGIRATIW